MRVAIIRPSYHSHLVTPPLGMGYICASLRQAGIQVSLIDGLKEHLDNTGLVVRCHEADVVGISCMSDYFWEVIDLSKRLKAAGKTVVIGGAHASVMPRETLEYASADYAIVGEGEHTLVELIHALERGEEPSHLPGVYGKNTTTYLPREFVKNLDELPFPAWDQINPATYPLAPHGAVVKAFPVAPITSSRGCPFACHFCASPTIWKRQIRYRSPKNVVDEIEMLVSTYQVREIHFEDDNLTLKRSHIEAICEEILQRNLKIHWATPNGIRVDAVSEDLLKLMKKSGCYSVAFGIESGSQKILDNIEKKTDIKQVCSAVKMAHAVGLLTQAFLIFGLPGETRETIEQTIELTLSLPLDKAQFLLLDLLPGTQLWEQFGQWDLEYFKKRSYQEPGFIPSELSAEELQRARARGFRKFHLRPRQCYQLLRMIKVQQVKYILQRIKDFQIFSS